MDTYQIRELSFYYPEQAQAALDLLELRHFGPILENIIRLGLPQTVEELQLPPKQRRKREK